jgi:hypothetical protein
MQFGRIHGIALAVLGIVLLGIQLGLYMTPRKRVRGAAESPTSTPEHSLSPLPGIVGIASLVGGIAVFVAACRHDASDPKNAVK